MTHFVADNSRLGFEPPKTLYLLECSYTIRSVHSGLDLGKNPAAKYHSLKLEISKYTTTNYFKQRRLGIPTFVIDLHKWNFFIDPAHCALSSNNAPIIVTLSVNTKVSKERFQNYLYI